MELERYNGKNDATIAEIIVHSAVEGAVSYGLDTFQKIPGINAGDDSLENVYNKAVKEMCDSPGKMSAGDIFTTGVTAKSLDTGHSAMHGSFKPPAMTSLAGASLVIGSIFK